MNQILKKKELLSSLDCLFAMLNKRIEIASQRAKEKVSSEEQRRYKAAYRSEIECGIEFPIKGMKEDLMSDPEYAIYCHNIGVCYFEQKKFHAAHKWFIAAIELIPRNYDYNDPYVYLEKVRREA